MTLKTFNVIEIFAPSESNPKGKMELHSFDSDVEAKGLFDELVLLWVTKHYSDKLDMPQMMDMVNKAITLNIFNDWECSIMLQESADNEWMPEYEVGGEE